MTQAEAAGLEAPAGYRIRADRDDDYPALLKVENRAAQLFRDHGYPAISDNPFASVEDFRAMAAGHTVWVAVTPDDAPVGYAVAGRLGRFLHLRELSVDPAHGRKGLGAALVRVVLRAGKAEGAEGVSLTTFRTVPFNAPFYEKLGFAEMPLGGAPEELRSTFEREMPPETDPSARVLMTCRC